MRVVIEHPKKGLFLGLGQGRFWWTELPLTAIITEVVTFNDKNQAEMFAATHFTSIMSELEYHEVEVSTLHAPIPALVAAGLGKHCSKLLLFTAPHGQA